MPDCGLIDWQHPAYRVVRAHGEALGESVLDLRKPVHQALNRRMAASVRVYAGSAQPISFVPQSHLLADEPYEGFIYQTGQVPTRDNWHDLFNGLVWLSLPRMKAALNRLQAEALCAAAQSAETARRGPVRDAATLLDENGVLLTCADEGLAGALRHHDWQALFVRNRAAFQRQCEVWVVGHALLDKLRSPYRHITGHALILSVEAGHFAAPRADRLAWVDELAAQWLSVWPLSTRALQPLPLMGVPDWYAMNAEPGFYDDATVFRPTRGST